MSEWIEWKGGECPVAGDVWVDVRLRNGLSSRGAAHCYRWRNDSEVAAYRLAYASSNANATQVGGDHYKSKTIQPWDYITSNGLTYLEGCVVKYVSRHREKGGVDDLKKARHYLDKLIEVEQREGEG